VTAEPAAVTVPPFVSGQIFNIGAIGQCYANSSTSHFMM
jgi:hypothetical protein